MDAGQHESFQTTDPATGEAVARYRVASPRDVADAVARAHAAFATWRTTPIEQRREIATRFAAGLAARKPDLARLISRETGKVAWESEAEIDTMVAKVGLSIRSQDERAGQRDDPTAFGRAALRHRPHGVLAVLGPYNFPGHLPNGHIVPALLAGNTVVLKPSEIAPGIAHAMADAWREGGLPDGVLEVVDGARATGEALLDSDIAGVLFTGSATTGVAIHQRFAGRPEVILALEMGGNNALIAWQPADPEAVASIVVQSAFITTGQRCSCARRLILPRGVWGDRVLEAVVALARQLPFGPWDAAPAPFAGTLVSQGAAARALVQVQDRIAAGATPLLEGVRDGAFLSLAISEVTAVQTPDEEVFAPYLEVRRVSDFDEALKVANATRFGLSGALVSDDPALWERAQAEMRAGVLNLNRPTTGASGALPFGGPGLSGNLRPSAWYAADYCAWPMAMQVAATAQMLAVPGLAQQAR